MSGNTHIATNGQRVRVAVGVARRLRCSDTSDKPPRMVNVAT